jgi:hypothetical protein
MNFDLFMTLHFCFKCLIKVDQLLQEDNVDRKEILKISSKIIIVGNIFIQQPTTTPQDLAVEAPRFVILAIIALVAQLGGPCMTVFLTLK